MTLPASASRAELRSHRTLDCAYKVRVHYQLPAPLRAELSAVFPEAEARIEPFSQIVAGARDHLRLSAKRFYAAGVVGEHALVVTFGKAPDGSVEEVIERFEAGLRRHLGSGSS